MKDYDVRSVFEQMELELIDSMKRNLSRHQKWETKEGMNWTMWQVEQLKTLEQFKKENQKIFKSKFTAVNNEIAKFLEDNYRTSGIDQEKAILKELAKGNVVSKALDKGLEGSFFHLNTKKMNALINATTNDMKTAETAMLRMVSDQYRKTIFRAQVMANSGAFTLQQSIDAATKDFLKAGINCIQYKDGRRVNIATYAEMAIRTANKRAILISEGDVRNAYGIYTVRISRYGQCSDTCLPWQGRIYVDDVYSGGTKEEAEEKKLPLLSEAIAGGLFHPNCKHRATTYFYDVKKSLGKLKDDGIENPPEEQEHRKNHLHIQQQKRFETGFLDSSNVEKAEQKRKQWEEKDKILEYKYETDKKVLNKYGEEITFDFKVNADRYAIPKDIIKTLSNQYNTRLQKVTYGAERGAGDVDITGSIMRINKVDAATSIHEFAHTLANSNADKYKLTNDGGFWKEIRKIYRQYHKDIDRLQDTSRMISTYEHSSRDVNEFMAEAFTHAKLRELGIDIPSKYGNDFTYSQKVLDTVDKYFKKDAIADIPEIKVIPEGQEKTIRKYTYEEIMGFANENEIILDKYISKKSKWSGIIRIEKNKSFKDWSCDIVISEETSPMIILHEQLHARSASYIKKEQYRNFRTIEEASVQLLTQEICQLEDIEIISSAYDEFADKLREINDIAGLYDNHLDFAIQLYSQNLSERNDWLEQKVYDKLMTEGNIDKLMKFNEIMNVMRMENPPWKLKK